MEWEREQPRGGDVSTLWLDWVLFFFPFPPFGFSFSQPTQLEIESQTTTGKGWVPGRSVAFNSSLSISLSLHPFSGAAVCVCMRPFTHSHTHIRFNALGHDELYLFLSFHNVSFFPFLSSIHIYVFPPCRSVIFCWYPLSPSLSTDSCAQRAH